MKEKHTKCKYCGALMDAKTTRKEFCSTKCRVYWNRENVAINIPAVAIMDATKPNTGVKNLTEEKPKTNFSVDTRPKNLEQLKALCPPELIGLDRSDWIRTERQKYGI